MRKVVASDVFRGLSIFIGSLAALLVSFIVRDLSHTIDSQRSERLCWFERTAEVDDIQARMQAITARIFVVAIINQEESDPPELKVLADELELLTQRLEPAIEAQEEATKDC